MVQAREVEGKLVAARGRLLARVREVTRRVEHTREALNLPALMRKHPLATAGVGIAAGLVLGSIRFGARRTAPGAVGAMLGGIAMRLAKAAVAGWMAGLVGPDASRAPVARR
ncbi:MAG: hypothetical protein K8W52_40080 [Deltaproteobacteria bacterium]|nr:hypothetical protein [Deltaproteobacteria bacterium]